MMRNPTTGLLALGLITALLAGFGFSAARAENCDPDGLGTSRVLAIDPKEFPRVGAMDHAAALPLVDREVVLTFDDGPIPPYTNQVLDILAAQCVKATFFLVGEMARAHSSTARRILAEGHTIGTHSEDHPLRFGKLPAALVEWEIDKGILDVESALGDPNGVAPFFRVPGLAHSEIIDSELAGRLLVNFSSDVEADDWHPRISPKKIITLAVSRLIARGKGILLLHDIHRATVDALPGMLKELKEHGFHIVQVVPAPAAQF
jgi:peptidoglycan/xylan/chitin deacetylase (PgdA/CDA1 family)